MNNYSFDQLIGKKVLIVGDLDSGKVKLLASLLDEAIMQGFERKITLIDMAPMEIEFEIGEQKIGGLVEEYSNNLERIRNLTPRRVYAPRIEAKEKKDVVKLSARNARNIGDQIREFKVWPTKILFINDITFYLHQGPLAIVQKAIGKSHTFIGTGYRGNFPVDDFDTGISRTEKKLIDKLTTSLSLIHI